MSDSIDPNVLLACITVLVCTIIYGNFNFYIILSAFYFYFYYESLQNSKLELNEDNNKDDNIYIIPCHLTKIIFIQLISPLFIYFL